VWGKPQDFVFFHPGLKPSDLGQIQSPSAVIANYNEKSDAPSALSHTNQLKNKKLKKALVYILTFILTKRNSYGAVYLGNNHTVANWQKPVAVVV